MLQRKTTPARSFFFKHLRRQLFHLPIEEASFARRGFRGNDNQARERLEQIGSTFLRGYHNALEETDPSALAQRLNLVDRELRGFAFEGAAMGLVLLDYLTPWNRRRLRSFVAGPGTDHIYMVHVGIGWAIGRLPWLRRHLKDYLGQLNPLLCWLALDGYGFHEGYFHWPHYVVEQKTPERLSAYSCRVFDQGLGRSLWFVDGGDAGRIPVTIAKFDSSRHADLWSGVGLACAYAGGVNCTAIEVLQQAAGPYRPQLAQGAAFAAKARLRAGNGAEHTEAACRILCGLSADAAASITDEALENLPTNGDEPAYETWQKRIQTRFATENLV